jgi:hypothetical protein
MLENPEFLRNLDAAGWPSEPIEQTHQVHATKSRDRRIEYSVAALTMGFAGSVRQPRRSTHHRNRAVRNGHQRSIVGPGSRSNPGKQAWVQNPDKDDVQGGCHRVPYETTHQR